MNLITFPRLFSRPLGVRGAGGGWQDVAAPDAAFSWLPFTIEQNGRTFRAKNWDVSSLATTGKAYYVSTSGNNANTGLSWEQAYRSIWQAASQADCVIIYVAAGQYNYDHNLRGVDGYFRSLIGVGGQVVMTNDLGLTGWSALDSHYTKSGVTETIGSVLDTFVLDAYGDYSAYTLKASAAEVDATAGSYYKDGSNVLHVHTLDNRAPDATIRVNRNIGPFAPQANSRTYYFENVSCEFGVSGTVRHFWLRSSSSTGGFKFVAKNCFFGYSYSNYDLLDCDGVEVYLQDCEMAISSQVDGANYHVLNSIAPKAVEIDCTMRRCGNDGNDQASTIHDAGTVVRIGGTYHTTTGQNIADVGAAQAWLLGCEMYGGTDGYYLGNSGAKAWLDCCNIHDQSQYGLNVESGTTVYHRALINTESNNVLGSLVAY